MGVSIVLYIVSRFSPEETRPMTVMTPNNNFTMQTQTITTHQTTQANEFTLLNSFWFSIAALMQQGCDFMPRSMPGDFLINFQFMPFPLNCFYIRYTYAMFTRVPNRSHCVRCMVVLHSHINLVIYGKSCCTFDIRANGSYH